MEPTRDFIATVAAAAALFVYAWVFDDRTALLACAALFILLSLLRLLVLSDIRQTVSSISVTRKTGKDTVRQGVPVPVWTRLQGSLPPGLALRVEEFLPAGCEVRDGSTRVECNGTGPFSHEIRYRATCYAIGPVSFRGLSLSFSHRFFEDVVALTRSDATGPTVHVDPVSAFERRPLATLDDVEREREHRAVLLGSGIRSFREYTAGDDPRHIDWKMTAKYDRLYVREYVGITGKPPLIILDLPEGESGEYPPGTDRLIGGVGEAISVSFREYHRFCLLVISGPNMVRFIEEGSDPYKTRREIAALRPVPLPHYFYRALDRGGARSAAKRAFSAAPGGSPAGNGAFATRLADWYDTVSQHILDSSFDGMLARVFAKVEPREIYCYTLLSGDLTHIRRLILRARRAGGMVRGFIPRERIAGSPGERLPGPGFDAVEAVR